MNKIMKYAVGFGAAATALGFALPAFAAADYLITASDTVPIFQSGAEAVKSNGLAVLSAAVPYLTGALVALAIIWIGIKVARHFRP